MKFTKGDCVRSLQRALRTAKTVQETDAICYLFHKLERLHSPYMLARHVTRVLRTDDSLHEVRRAVFVGFLEGYERWVSDN